MLESAGIPRFFQAAIEGVQSSVQVIQEDKADEREGKITAALGKGALKLRSIHEARDVIKHGGAEERFSSFQNEHGAISAGDGEIAPEKEPEFAEDADHSAMLRSGAPAPRRVRLRKTCAREAAPGLRCSAEGAASLEDVFLSLTGRGAGAPERSKT